MASAERAAIPFGLRRPTQEQIGLLAKRLMEEADAAIRRSRPRALLLLVPFLGFYMLYAGLLSMVLWGLGVSLPPPLFLGFNALVFAAMAVLGRYYRAGEMEVDGDMPRILAVMVLQAYILRGFTWFVFVIPYLAFRNLTRLFPRRARVSPEILEAAAQIAAALDTPVTARQLSALLPRQLPAAALAEALVLLEWAGVATTHPRGGETVIQPGPSAGGFLAALPQRAEVIPLSMILAAPLDAELSEEETAPPPGPASALARAFADNPTRAWGILAGGVVVLWVLVALGTAWYRRLPIELSRPTLPNVGEATGFSSSGDRLAVCRDGGVDLYSDLAAAPEESHDLRGLVRSDLHVRHSSTAAAPGSFDGGFDSEPGMAWDAQEEREVRVSFGFVHAAVPDPGGRYLLVYGDWRCDADQGTSCGRLGMGVVDLERWTFTSEEQFGGWAIKGWWEEGSLLAVEPSRGWDEGGGSAVESSNLAGTMAALDPATGDREELHRPPHAFFGLAGMEGGQRVFLGADWKADDTRARAECTLTEYREFRRTAGFTLMLKQFRPYMYDARLDATGRYWILAFGSHPGFLDEEKGTLYTVWVVSRGGGRRVQVMEARGAMPYIIDPFAYQGRPMFSCLTGGTPPVLSIHEIER